MVDEVPGEKKGKKNHSKGFSKKMKKNPWIPATFVLAVIVILVLSTGFSFSHVPQKKASEDFVEFINSEGSAEIEYVSSKDFGSGLYEVTVESNGQEIPTHITKDGKYFVQIVSPITSNVVDEGGSETDNTQPEAEAQDIPKKDVPEVELFVMSFCPYGNKAEDTMLPAYELLKDYVNFEVNYIVSVNGDQVNSLHGQPEIDQNIREICVLNEYGEDKFWSFVTGVNEECGSDGSCWESVATELEIDTQKIKDCKEDQGLELMKTHAGLSSEAGASGSPTLILNGAKMSTRDNIAYDYDTVVYKYGDSGAYKDAICSLFTEGNVPEECSVELESTTATTAGGSC